MDLREAQHTRASRHPWEVARFDFFAAILARAGMGERAQQVLDVGSGDAWFATQLLARLPEGSQMTCWDTGYTAIESPQAALTRTPVRPNMRADVVLLLDVLEHVEDDKAFLATLLGENTHTGSHVLISVPAWPLLFGQHDAYLKHHRRYAPAAAEALLLSVGLEIVHKGGLFHSLLVPRALGKVTELTKTFLHRDTIPDSDARWIHGAWMSRLARGVLAADNRLSHVFSDLDVHVPGLSWWAICKMR